MNKYIETMLSNEQCPLVNALFTGSGDMYVLENVMNNSPLIRVICKSTLENYFEYNDEDYVTSFDFQKEIEIDNYLIRLGEGGFGGDGVVSLSVKSTNELIWFLFLDNSNPFESARIEDDKVIVRSTSNVSIRIPILKPELITLQDD